MRFFARLALPCALALFAGGWMGEASAQKATPAPAAAAPALPRMRPASDLLKKPKGPVINKENEALVTPENSHVLISLARQRVLLMTGDTVYLDSPISSGKAGHETPSGSFTVLEKDPNHKSNIYGSFVDSGGRTVRSGVSSKIDSAPSGTHYVGASMKWFMRLSEKGVGMHVGILPGYPASHGCVRLPEAIAPLIYQKVKIGTPVVIDP
jgi:lipoprotein-anchoring transpeptidase ErfK/SrfK